MIESTVRFSFLERRSHFVSTFTCDNSRWIIADKAAKDLCYGLRRLRARPPTGFSSRTMTWRTDMLEPFRNSSIDEQHTSPDCAFATASRPIPRRLPTLQLHSLLDVYRYAGYSLPSIHIPYIIPKIEALSSTIICWYCLLNLFCLNFESIDSISEIALHHVSYPDAPVG